MNIVIDETYRLKLKRKQQIRKKIKIAAVSTPKDGLHKKSTLIQKNLYSLPEYNDAKAIYIYLSSFNHEVDTFSIIKDFMSKGGEVIVPIVNMKRNELIHSELRTLGSLKRSRFNVWEPEDKHIVNSDNVDMIIIPGIAYDLKGNRIGSGKGYFDRFLGNNDSLKIALAYEFQIIDDIPITDNDIPVDIIITERRIIRIKNF